MSFCPLFSRVGHYFWAMEFLFEEKDVFKCYTPQFVVNRAFTLFMQSDGLHMIW